MRDSKLSDVFSWIVIVFIFMVFIFGILTLFNRGLSGLIAWDFRVFYSAAKRFLSNQITLYGTGEGWMEGWLYPPPSILLFLPFTLVSFKIGYIIFSALLYASTVLASIIWISTINYTKKLQIKKLELTLLVGLVISSGMTYDCIYNGQVDPLVLLICVCALSIQAKKPMISGGLIAIVMWIKIYPVVLLFYMVNKRLWFKMLQGFIITAFSVFAISLLVVPFDLYINYFSIFLPELAGKTVVNIYNQSVPAVGMRIISPSYISLDTFDFYQIPISLKIINNIIVALLAGITFLTVKIYNKPRIWFASVLMALIPMYAPLGWGHAYIYTLPLLLLCLTHSLSYSKYTVVLIGIAYVNYLIPASYRFGFHLFPFIEQDTKYEFILEIIYSRYAIATLCLIIISWYLLAKSESNEPFAE